jgi:hypothetical protein
MNRNAPKAVDHQLENEARNIRRQNGFSPLLHERCMDALRRHGLPADTASLPHRPTTLWRFALPLGIAAAAAFATWLFLHTPTTPSTPQPEIVQTAPLPSLPENLTHPLTPALDPDLAASTSDSLEQRKYAYLDRDAQRLFTFVANQFPDFPQPPPPPNPPP